MLSGCKALSLTLREKRRLKLFENRILRRILGLKRDENGEWRRLHNVEHLSLKRPSNVVKVIKSRILRIGRSWSQNGGNMGVFKILKGKPYRK